MCPLEGSHESSKIDNNDFHRHIKGDVIDAMEEKNKEMPRSRM